MTVYERLIACGDEQYRDFQSRLVPNIPREMILGVRTPDMRRIAKEIRGRGRRRRSWQSFRIDTTRRTWSTSS